MTKPTPKELLIRKSKTGKTSPHHTGKLSFLGLRLTESKAKLGELKPDGLPGVATQGIEVALTADNTSKKISVKAQLELVAKYGPADEPAMSVFAVFVAAYSIVEEFTDEDSFKSAIEKIAMLNIWPYWREFVQSMTTRMGLPPFPIPLYYVQDQKPKLERADKLED